MLELFESPDRRIKDERELRQLYSRYGADTPTILSERAVDESLSSRDRGHWRRLARKARNQKNRWLDKPTSS
ncbi:hypothetical protein [Parasphingorhabdus sp.]|uniref:hypothetical protein n=1 Tax=Parasphingorhabdus sp. TaxID=2709688 RepID=UPI003264F6F3